MSDEIESLGATIVALLERVQRDGVSALASVVQAGGDPILQAALGGVAKGADAVEIEAAVPAAERDARVALDRRIAVARASVLALVAGEDPDAFRKRFEKIAG